MYVCVSIFVIQFVPESPRYLVYKGRSDKAAAILARAAKINKATLPEGKLVTLEEKERHLQLSKERQTVSPEANRNEEVDDETVMASDVTMVTAVRYRKEIADSCHGDDRVGEVSLQEEDYSVGEAIEMVAIKADSDKVILLPSQLKDQKKVIFYCLATYVCSLLN